MTLPRSPPSRRIGETQKTVMLEDVMTGGEWLSQPDIRVGGARRSVDETSSVLVGPCRYQYCPSAQAARRVQCNGIHPDAGEGVKD